MARGNGTWLTRSYNIQDRDPEIEKAHAAYAKEAGLKRDSELAVLAGLATGTVSNLWTKTRRPLHTTFAKVWGAMGYEYKATRDPNRKPDYEKELPLARAEFKQHKEQLKKKRGRQASTKRRK